MDRESRIKAVIFLADGMADESLPQLGGRTPLEAAATPAMLPVLMVAARAVQSAWNCETLPCSFLLWAPSSNTPPTVFFIQ